MGTINLNFAGVERPSFEPIPEDDYNLVVQDITIKPGKTDASKMIAHCSFSVVGGEYDGRKILHWQGLTGDSAPFAKVMFEAILGEPIDEDTSVEEDDIVGREFSAHVGIKVDNRDSSKYQNTIAYFILPFETE